MNVCIISPTSGLERFATLSKTHLVLAHINDEAYINFYLNRKRLGDHLILDNGAHEKGASIGWRDLAYKIAQYKPDVAVLPDILDDPIQTVSNSLQFLDSYAKVYPQVEWMFVWQGGLTNEEIRHNRLIFEDLRVGHLIKWVGITRYLTLTHKLKRTNVARYLKEQHLYNRQMRFHALGMCNGSLEEFEDCRTSNLFESLDTSVPVWRGHCGFRLRDTACAWPEIPVDFSQPKLNNIELIKENLHVLGIQTDNPQTHR